MRNIAVYCGSSNGASDIYRESGEAFGRELARRGLGLVYGGASVGVMGAAADGALAAGGRAIGVLPEFLQRREIAHERLTELHVVGTMHERKAKLAELADGFIALPGGPGTMEEFFEIFTWSQLNLHRKPIGLLSVNGYYDPLVGLLRHMATEGFLQERYLSAVIVDDDPSRLLDRFRTYEPPEVKSYE